MRKVRDLMTTKGLEKVAREIARGCKDNRPRELIIADAACDLHDAFPSADYETTELIAEVILQLCRNRKLMDDLANVQTPPISSNQ